MSETKYEVVKFIDDNIELDVNIDPYSETIWLTQSQMSILFGVDISRISRHIKNALNEEEINSQRNLRKTQIANSDKLVYLYDLDVIISVGYRVKSNIGVKFIDDNIELDVSIDPYSETIWLTQSQMSILFGVDISRISRHIKNALNEKEITSQRNLRKTQIANSDKLVYLYDLDVIISVGYRVKSIKGVIFRKWASKVLKEYLLIGYVINKERSLVTNENYVRLINKVE